MTQRNGVVLGISPDSIERLERFAEQNGVPFQLASDKSGQIRRLYDVRRRFGLGTSRFTYLIDREGIIWDVYHNEISMSSHVKRVLSVLDRIR